MKAVWEKGLAELQNGTLEPMQFAKAVNAAEAQESPVTNETRGAYLGRLWKGLDPRDVSGR